MSKLDKDQVIAKFTEAYKSAHGKEPQIEAKGGWYSIDGDKNVRLAQLEEMAEELSGKKTQKKASTASKTEDKPVAKKAAKAPAKAKNKAKGKSSGFSVKAYWAEQLAAKPHQCRQPR
ncbi:hypothetical protein [Bowmanella dokdonensis]|uniref:Uncharacterized protein n=1 Tax=Bowmanella dokdonensis TaxID=751969 RepID=A0A939DMD4_9ALTE|nr:hypothetical protein [Bowmanella dokdonensis]MBN7824441.1 hypothetical protein [Bowmanella dokdonensis]